jgi:hypothetical protein
VEDYSGAAGAHSEVPGAQAGSHGGSPWRCGGSLYIQMHPGDVKVHFTDAHLLAMETHLGGLETYIKGSVSRDFLGPFLACMDRSRSV